MKTRPRIRTGLRREILRPGGEAGFTLIELMVVIAIITLLAAMLLPALSQAKYTAKNTACKSNERQLGLAFQSYNSVYQCSPPFEQSKFVTNVVSWYDLLGIPEPVATNNIGGYPHLVGVFLCPLNQGMQATETSVSTHQSQQGTIWPWSTYGYNAWGIGQFPFYPFGLGGAVSEVPTAAQPFNVVAKATPDSAVRAPGRLIAFGDNFTRSVQSNYDGGQGIESVIAPDAATVAILVSATPYKQQASFLAHHGRCNRIFYDGHVEVEDMRKPFNPTDGDLASWNVDNQPHRNMLGP